MLGALSHKWSPDVYFFLLYLFFLFLPCDEYVTSHGKCAAGVHQVHDIFVIFLTTSHFLVLTLILHKNYTELHCPGVSLVSWHYRAYFCQPPSPHPQLLCTAPLIHNGMSHSLKRPLSGVHFCVHVCHVVFFFRFFFLKTSFSLFSILHHFCQPTRLMIYGYQFCFETIVKSPFWERLSLKGTPLHGVMHNSGLCEGGQACCNTD